MIRAGGAGLDDLTGGVHHIGGVVVRVGDVQTHRIDDDVLILHGVAQLHRLLEGAAVLGVTAVVPVGVAAAGPGVLGDDAVAVGRVELAVGHHHHDLEQVVGAVSCGAVHGAGPQAVEVGGNRVPAPGQPHLSGGGAARRKLADLLGQIGAVAGQGDQGVGRAVVAGNRIVGPHTRLGGRAVGVGVGPGPFADAGADLAGPLRAPSTGVGEVLAAIIRAPRRAAGRIALAARVRAGQHEGVGRAVGHDVGRVVQGVQAVHIEDADLAAVLEPVVVRGDGDGAVVALALHNPAVAPVISVGIGIDVLAGRGLQAEGVGVHAPDPERLIIDLGHAAHVPDIDEVAGLEAVAVGGDRDAAVALRDRGDRPGGSGGPGGACDVAAGRRCSARGVGHGAEVHAHGIRNDRRLGVVGRLLGLHDQLHQLGGGVAQGGDAAAGHGPGDVQHQGHLKIGGRTEHLGFHAHLHLILQDLAVGGQEDVGHQGVHVHLGVRDHRAVFGQVEGCKVLAQGDLGIGLKVGAQGGHAYGRDAGVVHVG